MERRVGEIFEYNGEWYQCVSLDYNTCQQCDIHNHGVCPIPARECFARERSDRTSVVFKRLEKVGEPVLYGLRISQRYKVSTPVELSKDPSAPWMSYNFIDNLLYIEVKQDKENTEDMEANEKTMPVPDGWEFDHLDERGNIVLKKKKKELPNMWFECLRTVNETEYINEGSTDIYQCKNGYVGVTGASTVYSEQNVSGGLLL